MVRHIACAQLPTKWGEFFLHGFLDEDTDKEHIALRYGDIEGQENVLVRVHSECLTGDSLFSLRCDCGPQLEAAMRKIAENGSGVIIYLRQEC